MTNKNLLMDGIKLPPPLTKKEIYELFEKFKLGDSDAREKIIIHNMRLVLNEVQTKFWNTPFDKEELVASGLIGLIKSVDKFDISRGLEFTTFACVVIDNQIKMYMRNENKQPSAVSIYCEDENELTIEDRLCDYNIDIEADYIHKEQLGEYTELLNFLSEQERKIMMLYFGFYNDKKYKQKEIAEMLSLSQSAVSKIIINSLKKLKKYSKYRNNCSINSFEKKYNK